MCTVRLPAMSQLIRIAKKEDVKVIVDGAHATMMEVGR